MKAGLELGWSIGKWFCLLLAKHYLCKGSLTGWAASPAFCLFPAPRQGLSMDVLVFFCPKTIFSLSLVPSGILNRSHAKLTFISWVVFIPALFSDLPWSACSPNPPLPQGLTYLASSFWSLESQNYWKAHLENTRKYSGAFFPACSWRTVKII